MKKQIKIILLTALTAAMLLPTRASAEPAEVKKVDGITALRVSTAAELKEKYLTETYEVEKETNVISSGTCGKNIAWTLEKSGILTLSGTGEMYNYGLIGGYVSHSPWEGTKAAVREVLVQEGITSIGNEAFANCSSIRCIQLPLGIVNIGEKAFYQCTRLEEIVVPCSVKGIGKEAFSECKSLTSAKLSDGLESIGCKAFMNCEKLISITIPSSIKQLDDYALYCISDVYFDGYGLDWLQVVGKNNVVYTTTNVHFKDNLYGKGSCGTNVTWELAEDGILTISGNGPMANYSVNTPWGEIRDKIRKVIIKDGVTSIGNSAFELCQGLTTIELPASIVSLGHSAFERCKNLENIEIPSSVKTMGQSSFSGCERLASIVIPENVTAIASSTFYGCTNLSNVVIPNSMTDIGDSAFRKCDKIEQITIPKNVNSIGQYAFSECSALKNVVLPGGIRSIGSNAFEKCTSLSSILLPGSIISLGSWLFSGCVYMTDAVIEEGIINIEDHMFDGCSSLSDVIIPDSLKRIGTAAFYNCNSLTSVSIPSSVCKVEYHAFYECDNLCDIYYGGNATDWLSATDSDVVFPQNTTIHYKDEILGKGNCGANIEWLLSADGVLTISGVGAMYDYSYGEDLPSWYKLSGRIYKVVINLGVSNIGSNMFENCKNLKSIMIPSSVTSIGYDAFFGCVSLSDVYYGGDEGSWATISITKVGNQPLENVYVWFASCGEGSIIPANATMVVKDENGNTCEVPIIGGKYSFALLPYGSYTIQVEKSGYIPNEIVWIYTDTNWPPDITLVKRGNINGTGSGVSEIDASDMQCLYTYLTSNKREGKFKDDPIYFAAVADVNGDGHVDVYDLQMLYEAISGINSL